MADGWAGFRGRLAYAIDQRKLARPELTQNAIAEAAGMDSGQISKILSGKRTRGVAANTVLLLAEALDVRPLWLMTGEEPSGISRKLESTIPPAQDPAEPDSRRAAASGRS
jgi:transcriptional regulator with XRE-family HTH domain